jgi:uncharacterized protein (DUF2236 family)
VLLRAPGGGLSDGERSELWEDYIRFGELFGLPRDAMPGSYASFRAYYRERLASDEMFLTDEARYIGYATAFEIPLPRLHQPAKRVHDLIMLGSLPSRVRSLYGLPYGMRERAAFGAAVRAVRAVRRFTPAPLARGWNTNAFERVARTERFRIQHGRPTPQVRDPIVAAATPPPPGAAASTTPPGAAASTTPPGGGSETGGYRPCFAATPHGRWKSSAIGR